MIKKIIAGLTILIVLAMSIPMPVTAADTGLKIGDKFVIDNGAVVEYLGMKDGLYQLKATFGAPQYLDDLQTPIDCSWTYNPKTMLYESGDNLYSVTAKNDGAVTLTYKGKKASWSHNIYIGFTKLTCGEPMLLYSDPINKNYKNNTLQWVYSTGITLNLRIIEGMFVEYWQIPSLPAANIKITTKLTRDIGFPQFDALEIWDAKGRAIPNSTNINGDIIIEKSDLLNSVFPITIDPDTTFTTSASDGHVYNNNANYNTTRTAASGAAVAATGIYWGIGQSNDDGAGLYFVVRGAVYFDTSALPDGSEVQSAILKLYGKVDYSTANFDITVQTGTTSAYPHDPLVVGDYNYNNITGAGGTVNTSTFTTVGYNSITLSGTGETWISLTGTTKFYLRSAEDINNSTPVSDEYVIVYSYEQGAGFRPTLEVTYGAASNPTILAQAASSVANTTARLNGSITDDGGGACEVRWGYGTASQIAGDFLLYDTVTAWSGAYSTGQNPYLDVASLVNNTPYYYRFQAQNDHGVTTSGEITFTTTNAIDDVADFRGIGQYMSVSLTWGATSGASQYLVRYSTTAFPTAVGDGTEAYFGSSTSYRHEGLEGGENYYYSIWGESGGGYSTNYATALVTTLATEEAGAGVVPDEPDRWVSSPNYTNLSNLPMMYNALNALADSLDIPRESMWFLVAILTSVALSVVVFTFKGNHSMMAGMVAMTLFLSAWWAVQILPFWLPIFSIVITIGLAIGRRETAS